MISPESFLKIMNSAQINFFTGVPDSTFKNFCHFIISQQNEIRNVVAVNEGNAIALAIGNYIGSGKPSLVYLQNSGIGNTLNPLLSLADKEVYSIPMLLLVGWRGYPDVLDEPQHVKQGYVTKKLLEAIEIPFFEMDSSTDPISLILSALEVMHRENCPVVLLTREDLFEDDFKRKSVENHFDLTRRSALQTIAEYVQEDSAVFTTTGFIAREFMEIRDQEGIGEGSDFMCIGGMGHVSAIATGFAMATKSSKKVVCLDGDGSLLMHMGALTVSGQNPDINLLHIVLNNGSHESVGGHPTLASDLDLHKIARACGYKETAVVVSKKQLEKAFLDYSKKNGISFIEIKISTTDTKKPLRPSNTPRENLINFLERQKI